MMYRVLLEYFLVDPSCPDEIPQRFVDFCQLEACLGKVRLYLYRSFQVRHGGIGKLGTQKDVAQPVV